VKRSRRETMRGVHTFVFRVFLALFDQIAEEIFTAWADMERPDEDVLTWMWESLDPTG
jgi:hypothetical protein